MKIKYSLLERLPGLTTCEMDLFVYAARRQDETGKVTGLYYGEVCKGMGMCKQSFYNALHALEEKEVIRIERHTSMDYDIKILDNDFSYRSALQEGYINLNRKVLHSKGFKKLKAREKWLFFEFMKITHSSQGSYQIGVKKLYTKYQDLLRVTRKVVTGYLHSLKQYFSIGIKNGKYFITYRKSVFTEKYEISERKQYVSGRVKAIFRRNGIKSWSDPDIKECTIMIDQYISYAALAGLDIWELFDRAVKTCGNCISTKYINKLLNEAVTL